MFLDEMDFGFEEKAISPSHINRKGFIGSLISAGAGLLGGLLEDDEPDAPDRSVQPSTVSDQMTQDTNFLFNLEASEAMDNLVSQLNEWSGTDREFFENTFQPFQADLMEANQKLIPGIVANAGEAMKQSLKDLMGGDFLKDSFRNQIERSGGDIGKFAESFSKQIDDIPTAEQRVGEAVSGVEQRFGEAGAELKRQMAAQGLNVSQASQRELAIEKAKAKAGAVGVAAEAARKEQLAGAQAGVGVAADVQAGQANLLASQQQLAQTGAMLAPQIGGVQQTGAVSEAGKLGVQATTAASEKILGTEVDKKGATITQTGVVAPKFYDKETGALVDAAGQPIPEPVAPVGNPMNLGASRGQGGDRIHGYQRDPATGEYTGSDSYTGGLANQGRSGGSFGAGVGGARGTSTGTGGGYNTGGGGVSGL